MQIVGYQLLGKYFLVILQLTLVTMMIEMVKCGGDVGGDSQ